MISGKVLL